MGWRSGWGSGKPLSLFSKDSRTASPRRPRTGQWTQRRARRPPCEFWREREGEDGCEISLSLSHHSTRGLRNEKTKCHRRGKWHRAGTVKSQNVPASYINGRKVHLSTTVSSPGPAGKWRGTSPLHPHPWAVARRLEKKLKCRLRVPRAPRSFFYAPGSQGGSPTTRMPHLAGLLKIKMEEV